MRNTILERLRDRFQSWRDLAEGINDDMLDENLNVENSKSLRVHYWCVIGAREAYTKALAAGNREGFEWTLSTISASDLSEKLAASASEFDRVVGATSDWTQERDTLLTELHEHEVMHEGQVIRLMYGLGHELPKSCKWA